MSDQVTTAFVKQFGATVDLKTQQMGSAMRGSVMEEPLNGEEGFFEQIGATSANEVTTRHGDSPLNATPHDRRRVTLRFFDWGDLIDKFDKVRMLINPESPYVQTAAAAMGRCIDDVLLGAGVSGEDSIASYGDGSTGAFYGTAYTGKAGGTSTSFDSNNTVAVNFGGTNVGMTVPKWIEVRRILKAGNLDLKANPLYCALSAQGEADLLNTTQVTSTEYNSVKALVTGEVDRFLSTEVRRHERIPKNGSSQWLYPFWVKSGVKLAVGADIQSQIAQRGDKKFSWYAYICMGFGAVRMEEKKVARVTAV